MTAPGANLRLATNDVTRARPLIASARVLLLQLENPIETVGQAVAYARDAGAIVVLDPAPAVPVADALLRNVHVRPNAREAGSLTGVDVRDRASARRAAEQLLRRGAGAACVATSDGNLLLSQAGELWLPHWPVQVRDTTGAGDAFAAGLAVELARSQSLEDAARFASAAAALSTTQLGAQAGLPRRNDVFALLERLAANPVRLGSWTPSSRA